MTSTSEQFLKTKDIVDLCRVDFCISKLFIQFSVIQVAAVRASQVVLTYIYMNVSLLVPVCPVCVCVCDIKVLAEAMSPSLVP